MSISYHAIPIRDLDLVGPIVEGTDSSHRLDEAKIRAALLPVRSLEGAEQGSLTWEVNGDYIVVDIRPTHVLVTHNAGRGSAQIEVLTNILHRLSKTGLFVYDPQQGSWFEGS